MTDETSSHTELVQKQVSSPGEALALSGWLLALVISAALGWLGLHYCPIRYHIPEKLANVSPNSPKHLQDELRAEEQKLRWKNAVTQFGFASTWMAMPALAVALMRRRSIGIGVLGIPLSLGSGFLGGWVGVALQKVLRAPGALSFVGEDSREVFADVLLFGSVTLCWVVPFACLAWVAYDRQRWQRLGAIVVAGVLTAVLAPIVVSVALSGESTDAFPLLDSKITLVWLATLIVAIFLLNLRVGTSKAQIASLGSQ